jgi:hypothetical protein
MRLTFHIDIAVERSLALQCTYSTKNLIVTVECFPLFTFAHEFDNTFKK